MTAWASGVAVAALFAATLSGVWLARDGDAPVHAAREDVPTWSDPALVFEVFAGADSRWGDAETLDRVSEAAKVWSDRGTTGSRVRFVIRVRHADGVAERDGTNAIVFRDDRWCPPGKQKREACYPDSQPARTQTYVASAAGQSNIVEADIQINAVSFDWQKPPENYRGVPAGGLHSAAPPTSLSALLAHEFGHAVGLEHPCAVGWLAQHAAGLPPCESVADEVRASTLYPLSFWSERTPPPLSHDVIGFLRRTYPL